MPPHPDGKYVVRQFFDALSSQGFAAALDKVADDIAWWTPLGTMDKTGMASLGELLESHVEGGRIRFELGTMTAEEDRIALEAKSSATLKNGRVYANEYHFLIRIAHGKIAEVREHGNSLHAADIWGDLIPM